MENNIQIRGGKRFLLSGCLMLSFFLACASPKNSVSNDPQSSLKKDTYTNPVIYADYSDPDVVATPDGKTFYMTASSFQCAPGLPILKSNNLVDWQLVNHAIDSVPPTDIYGAGKPLHGNGVWAPCIKYHDGEYYIYWGDPDFGIFMVKTQDPEGKWSTPLLVREGKGLIDTTPLWDEDGKAYLANAWAKSRSGFNSIITISEMSPDGTTLIGKPRIVYDGHNDINYTIEGPKLYKRGEYYYILAPAGGVETGWQLALRSKDIYGPYEAKIVMAQGDTDINGPHQGGWVTTAEGEDWFINFQDKGPYGRIIHLNPMEWKDNWPVIGVDKNGDGCGEPVRTFRKPKISGETASSVAITEAAGDLFQWHSNYNDLFGFPISGGMMRLYSHPLQGERINLWEVPNLWLMKFPAEEFTFTAEVKISGKSNHDEISSGIVVMGMDYCRLGLTERDGKFVLQMAVNKKANEGGEEAIYDIKTLEPDKTYDAGSVPNIESNMWFKVKVTKDAVCHFYYSSDGKSFQEIDRTFKAREGRWIGAKIGFYSIMPDSVNECGWIDIKNVIIE